MMRLNELVLPDRLLSVAQAKAEELLSAITVLAKRSKNAIEGRLRLARRKNSVHYFHVTESSPEQGVYIPQADTAIIKKLVQKDYEAAALKELQRELTVIDRFISEFHPETLDAIYLTLAIERRNFAEPVRLSDEEFATRWRAVKYACKPVSLEASLQTSREERVRSKSEVIIADTLYRLGIPYRYEFPHQMKFRGNRRATEFHPDFTCLNIATRREFIWEHFGLMDDPTYAAPVVEKMDAYIANGYFFGDNFLFTMETQDHPLTPATVETLAKKFLK